MTVDPGDYVRWQAFLATEIAAWQCEICKNYRPKDEAPTLLIVAVPAPVTELVDGDSDVGAPFFKRRLVICATCYGEINGTWNPGPFGTTTYTTTGTTFTPIAKP